MCGSPPAARSSAPQLGGGEPDGGGGVAGGAGQAEAAAVQRRGVGRDRAGLGEVAVERRQCGEHALAGPAARAGGVEGVQPALTSRPVAARGSRARAAHQRNQARWCSGPRGAGGGAGTSWWRSPPRGGDPADQVDPADRQAQRVGVGAPGAGVGVLGEPVGELGAQRVGVGDAGPVPAGGSSPSAPAGVPIAAVPS